MGQLILEHNLIAGSQGGMKLMARSLLIRETKTSIKNDTFIIRKEEQKQEKVSLMGQKAYTSETY